MAPEKCIADPSRDCLGLAKADEQYSKILDKLNDMQADINKALLSIAEFKEKSGKRWDKIVDKILLLVITACVGYILIKFGLPV